MSKAGEIIKSLTEQKASWSMESGQKLTDEISTLKDKYKEDKTITNLLWYFGYIADSVAKRDSVGVVEYANKLHNDLKKKIPNIE